MPQLTDSISSWLWLICSGITIVGCAYAIFSALLLHGLSRRRSETSDHAPPVTILKPLFGAEPQLAANLASFLAQTYPSDVQIVCGVRDDSDPAIDVVRGLERRTGRTLDLTTGAPDLGPNRKISNIVNMMKRSRHNLLVLSDSDMRVPADYVSRVAAPFEDPAVGLVTCLYRGVPVAGFWSRLHAASIDHHFLPNALVGIRLGLAEPCFGSTIALRRETLEKIGGFEAFAGKLADDYEIGQAVRRTGARVVIPDLVLCHTCGEDTAGEVFAHELRWARTIRLMDPIGYAGSIVTHPLPMALIAGFFGTYGTVSLALIVLALACRSLVPLVMQRGFAAEGASIALGPARDFMSFAIFLASFLPLRVTWRGQSYRVRADGTMTSE